MEVTPRKFPEGIGWAAAGRPPPRLAVRRRARPPLHCARMIAATRRARHLVASSGAARGRAPYRRRRLVPDWSRTWTLATSVGKTKPFASFVRGCAPADWTRPGASGRRPGRLDPAAGTQLRPYRVNVTTGVSERYGAVLFPRKSLPPVPGRPRRYAEVVRKVVCILCNQDLWWHLEPGTWVTVFRSFRPSTGSPGTQVGRTETRTGEIVVSIRRSSSFAATMSCCGTRRRRTSDALFRQLQT